MDERVAAFKRGFLTRMAELGRLPSDFEQGLAKLAAGPTVTSPTSLGKFLAFNRQYGVPLLLGTPLAVGTLLGNAAHRAALVDDRDVEEAKDQETARHYQDLAKTVQRRVQLRKKQLGV